MARLILSDDQVATLRRLWGTGLRRDQIAEAAGLTIDSLASAKRALGLPDLPRGNRRATRAEPTLPTPAEISRACAEIRRGWSPEETAVRQGYSPLGDVETEAARKWKIVPLRDVLAAWER
jgi:hypothetical protein